MVPINVLRDVSIMYRQMGSTALVTTYWNLQVSYKNKSLCLATMLQKLPRTSYAKILTGTLTGLRINRSAFCHYVNFRCHDTIVMKMKRHCVKRNVCGNT